METAPLALLPESSTVPVWFAPLIVNAYASAALMYPGMVSVLPVVAAKPPPDVPTVMPRLTSKVTLSVTCSAPPSKVNWVAVVLPGTAPKLASLLIERMPPLIVVIPV